jgi:hypothetical protein
MAREGRGGRSFVAECCRPASRIACAQQEGSIAMASNDIARNIAAAAVIASALALQAHPAHAQVSLSAYTDANGFVNVQALTCAQLANTWQEDADYLVAWYSGWYNGLAQKHYAHIARVKAGEHQLILYCKVHPELKIIQAMDVLFKNEQHKQ